MMYDPELEAAGGLRGGVGVTEGAGAAWGGVQEEAVAMETGPWAIHGRVKVLRVGGHLARDPGRARSLPCC